MTYRKPLHRARCPECNREVGVKRDGTLYKHGQRYTPCRGSNLTFIERWERNRAERIAARIHTRAAAERAASPPPS